VWDVVKNGDAVEWWREWSRLRLPFYSSGGLESGCPGRVVGLGGADSMLHFGSRKKVSG
jgi:hypothetical protein